MPDCGVVYHEINFGLSAKDILRIVDHQIALFVRVLGNVAKQKAPTFANTVAPIAHQDNEFEMATGFVLFLQYVSPDIEIRDACATANLKATEFGIQYEMREDVYSSIRTVFENETEMANLCPEDRRYIESCVYQFKRNGMSLTKDKRKQLAYISICINKLENEFYTNISEQEAHVLLTKDELEGVPKEFFNDRKSVSGAYTVSARHQDYSDVMNYAINETTRKNMYVANGTMCSENVKLLQETVSLRQKLASLLGYSTFADYVTETQLAKSPQAVYEMNANIRDKLYSIASKEAKQLESAKIKHMKDLGKLYTSFYDWDYSFYSNAITMAKHGIARNNIREYFSTASVVKSALNLYQKMLGLKIFKIDNPQGWHPDVQMYEVWERSNNKFVGHAYLDLFVRKGKYSGAAVWAVRPGFERLDGTHVHPVSAMVANFAGPTSTRPALMSHGDIKIILHELAHLFHNICSVTKWSRFHGTSCRETDYVEAPSQMMENWAWEPVFLRQFAKHYKTGEPISDKMLQNLINSRNDELGMDKLSQLFLGTFDLSIHNSANEKHCVSELFNSMQADMTFSNCGDAKVFKVASCEHLMSGYAGTYYAYLWAEIISADMFATRFKAHGIGNPKTGMDFRREILLPGGSRDASVSIEHFLGRKPNSDAFFKMISR